MMISKYHIQNYSKCMLLQLFNMHVLLVNNCNPIVSCCHIGIIVDLFSGGEILPQLKKVCALFLWNIPLPSLLISVLRNTFHVRFSFVTYLCVDLMVHIIHQSSRTFLVRDNSSHANFRPTFMGVHALG